MKKTKKAFEKKDMKIDKKNGLKEDSKMDKKMDAKDMKNMMKGAKTIAKIEIKAKPMSKKDAEKRLPLAERLKRLKK